MHPRTRKESDDQKRSSFAVRGDGRPLAGPADPVLHRYGAEPDRRSHGADRRSRPRQTHHLRPRRTVRAARHARGDRRRSAHRAERRPRAGRRRHPRACDGPPRRRDRHVSRRRAGDRRRRRRSAHGSFERGVRRRSPRRPARALGRARPGLAGRLLVAERQRDDPGPARRALDGDRSRAHPAARREALRARAAAREVEGRLGRAAGSRRGLVRGLAHRLRQRAAAQPAGLARPARAARQDRRRRDRRVHRALGARPARDRRDAAPRHLGALDGRHRLQRRLRRRERDDGDRPARRARHRGRRPRGDPARDALVHPGLRARRGGRHRRRDPRQPDRPGLPVDVGGRRVRPALRHGVRLQIDRSDEGARGTSSRALLGARGIRPKKRLGQHFLMDGGTAARIARLAVDAPGERALEVGAGTGALTAALARRGARVTAFDVDPDMVAILRERADLAGVDVRLADALAFDYAAWSGDDAAWRVAGNLPYNVATPLLTGLAALSRPPARVVAMIQKDVAERLLAKPGTAQYGSLTVAIALTMRVERALTVPPSAFFPRPGVVSSVVVLHRREAPAAAVRSRTAARRSPTRSPSRWSFRANGSRRRSRPSRSTPTSVVKISTSARSPLSLTRWPSDAFVWWRSLVVLLTLGAAFVVAQMLQLTWLSATHAHVDPRKLVLNWNILALQLAVYAPVLPALLTGLHWAAQRPLREVGMRLPTTFEATIGVTGGLAAYAITMAISLVQTALTHVRPEQQVVDALSGAHDPTIIAAFAFFACVLAPFVEETAFRGFLFN